MIISNIICERDSKQKTCKLYQLRQNGVKNPKTLIADGCLKCKSCKIVITSAGWTRANKGIDHLVNAATTLEAFEDGEAD